MSESSELEYEWQNYEQEFVAMMNRERNHPLWADYGFGDDLTYLVNVSHGHTSKLIGAKVLPKSDCYVIRTHDDLTAILLAHDFFLTEDILEQNNIKAEPLERSGISIKRPDSKHYTLQKLVYHTFQEIFDTISPKNFVAALLFVDKKQLYKNQKILADFKTNVDELCEALEIAKSEDEAITYKNLKDKALKTIKDLANTDGKIYRVLCFGEGIFDEPYQATFIYEGARLLHKDDYLTEIIVTTGSGRSKGTYTLAFK